MVEIDGQLLLSPQQENPFSAAADEGIFDSGCSRSMTGNKERLDDFQEFQGGRVTFRGGQGQITRKGIIRTPTLDFGNVYYVKELQQFNLFFISQICDKKNRVLFTDTECLVLSKNFKFPDESMVVLRVPRKHNLYTIKLSNLCPRGNLACLVTHASVDESVKWHRRMGYANYKIMNRLAKGNLVRENQLNKKVKTIRCDNGTEFKNALMIEFCGSKGIKREYSNARTSQQNRVAERKNRTLIEAARTIVSVTSPHDKTPYALLTGNIPSVSHFKPFGCHVTILNTSDHLGKFDGKADEGYIIGYSASNKAHRVYNVPNKRVEETMNLRRGTIDKTLFLKKNNRDIILVQVYVDDIIFGSTKKAWCDKFKALMKGEFQMSAMRELTLFIGLQVQQRPDGVFINQEKYVQEILNKFDLRSVRTATTPYEATKPKSKNESDSLVNVHLYRFMMGSLMYLTALRPHIMFVVSACSRNQVTPTTSNLEAVKKIFKYLKGQPKLGLWYPKELPLVLEAYSDSDYAGANKDRKSTTGGCQFLGRRLISWQCKKQTIVATSSTEAEYVAAANCCG
nr:uncharacterized mitochondrial protein AtMg00810-like [Tanacetum cinerariifolium]